MSVRVRVRVRVRAGADALALIRVVCLHSGLCSGCGTEAVFILFTWMSFLTSRVDVCHTCFGSHVFYLVVSTPYLLRAVLA